VTPEEQEWVRHNARTDNLLMAKTQQGVYIQNMMTHPKLGIRKLPKGRLRRLWLRLRGWTLIEDWCSE
jgi:hypothetical protein